MITYIIKSLLCSLIFWLVYKILLEKEKMHVFKRFYLLASLIFSLVIPALTFSVEIESLPIQHLFAGETAIEEGSPEIKEILSAGALSGKYDVTKWVIWSIYLLGCLFWGIRFFTGLFKYRTLINHSETVTYGDAKLVSGKDIPTPFSFFNYIFVNKNNRAEEEVLYHELVHVRQAHTWDKIFIELLQVVWWFNPILIAYKKDIYTNHEFLADESVLRKYENISHYQTLLISNCKNHNMVGIASQFNFHVIKKRLLMMTKKEVPGIILLKKVTMIPVFISIFVLFSSIQTTHGQCCYTPAKEVPSTRKGISHKLMREYHEITDKYLDTLDGEKVYNLPKTGKDFTQEEEEKMYTIYIQMSQAQQTQQTFYFEYPFTNLDPPLDSLLVWQDEKKYLVMIDDEKIDNFGLSRHIPTDFGGFEMKHYTQIVDGDYDKRIRVSLYTTDYCNRRPPLLTRVKSVKFDDDRIICIPIESDSYMKTK